MLKNKSLLVIFISVIATAVLVGVFTFGRLSDSKETFAADGFILAPSTEQFVTDDVNNQYYFSAGTKYLEAYGNKVVFKDTQGNEVTLDTEKFIHYLDGSLGALTKGVLLEADAELVDDQVVYYSVSKNTTIYRNGNTYTMTTLDTEMEMSHFIWKISDTTYLIAAPEIILHLSDDKEVTFPDYVQLEYVSEGIVRIIHQLGTYQTVSSEAFLSLSDDITLNLSGKTFYVNDEEGVSLSSMVIGSEENIVLDEDKEELQMPTFNVVNGANGAPGATGEDGDIGEEGEDGEDGENGEDGEDGNAGKIGNNGAEGKDGTEGNDGDSGEWGYDGEDGEDGRNADNYEPSGIIAVNQLQAPTISMKTENYKVGANSVSMHLEINDANALLQDDLSCQIYNMATGETIELSKINRSNIEAIIQSASLVPDTEYALIVSGKYSKDGTTLPESVMEGDLFIKKFKTDSIGLSLEKVKVTEDSISFKTIFDGTSSIKTYQLIAKYIDEGGVEQTVWTTTILQAPEGEETVERTINGLDSNTEYTIWACNLEVETTEGTTESMVESNINLPLKTLKKTPYISVTDESGKNITLVNSIYSSTTLNQRDKTLSVCIPTLIDEDNGIIGYRYELYETNDAGTLLTPVQTAESSSLMIKGFDLTYGKSYTARVVVLFDDNEKTVEFATIAPRVTNLPDGLFPVVDYKLMNQQHESLKLSMTISDPNGMLLSNVSSDYPIRVTFANTYGDALQQEVKAITITENTSTFVIEESGLRKDCVYTISVTGPVNTTDTKWMGDGGLTQEQRNTMKNTYLSGIQYDTAQTALVVPAYFDVSQSSTEPFAMALNTRMYTSALQQGGDPEYNAEKNSAENTAHVLGTVNSMSFVIRDEMGTELGTATVYDSTQSTVNTQSEFYNDVFWDGVSDSPRITGNLTLTPSTFGVAPSQLKPGEKYKIQLTSVKDYVGNELEYLHSTSETTVEIAERHLMVSDPYRQIQIVEIKNTPDMAGTHYNPNFSEDTVVGIKLIPSYGLGDVLNLKYTAYEISDTSKAPSETDNVTLKSYAAQGAVEMGSILYSFGSHDSASTGQSYIGANQYLDIFFGEKRNDFDTDSDNDYKDEVEFKRGVQYFFRYEVTTDQGYAANCHEGEENDVYPYCVYLTATPHIEGINEQSDVPFYRSPLYAASRQIPTVERYPGSSDTDSVTWKYRLFDPDGAIAESGETKQIQWVKYSTLGTITDEMVEKDLNCDGIIYLEGNIYYDESADNRKPITIGSLESVECAVSTDPDANFTAVKLSGLNDGQRYRTAVSYRVSSDGEVEKTVSDIWKFRKKTTVALPEPEGAAGSTELSLHTIEDYGGGELRLRLIGEGVLRYSALKVTISHGAESVVYDPVFFEVQSGLYSVSGEAKRYACAYLNYEPIAAWQKQNVNIKVEGYYNTQAFGMDTFDSECQSATKLSESTSVGTTAYTLYNVKDEMYMKAATNLQFANIEGAKGMASSFVAPDAPKITQQYDELTGTYNEIVTQAFVKDNGNSALRMQYAFRPIVTAGTDGIAVLDTPIVFDQNGMYLSDGNMRKYFIPEILQIVNVGTVNDFYLEELLPTVKMESISTGVKTTNMVFIVEGNVTADTEIYMELFDTDNNTMVPLDIQKDVVEGKNYYSVKAGELTHSGLSTADGPFRVAFDATQQNGKLNVTITGLQASTAEVKQRYGVKLYVTKKDDAGNVIKEVIGGATIDKRYFLYDTEYRQSGKLYEFSTRENVVINLKEENWNYINYQEKYGIFDYRIDGAGMGYILKYSLIRVSDKAVIVGETELARLGTIEQYKYYDNEFGHNERINLSMNPGGAVLAPGVDYELIVKAYDNAGSSDSDIGTQSLFFTTAVFKKPTSKYSVTATANTLNINYVITDKYRTIYNVTDTQTAGPYTMTVTYVNQAGETVTHLKEENLFGNIVNKEITGLPPVTVCEIKIEAKLDLDNDGVVDEALYTDTFTGSTLNTTTASTTAYTVAGDNHFIISLENLSNFAAVKTVEYSIYGSNAAVIGSESIDISAMIPTTTGGYQYTSGYAASTSGMHYLSIKFYDESGVCIGNVLNSQFNISTIY